MASGSNVRGFSRLAIGSNSFSSSNHGTGKSVARSSPPHERAGVAQSGASRSADRAPSRASIGSKASASAQRLAKAQSKVLSGILEDVRAGGAERYVKNDHWAWYVWPTTKEGISDPFNTAVKDVADVVYILGAPTLGTWAALLEALAAALRARGSRRVFPSIDHGRIDFFLREWGSAEFRERMPHSFESAFDQFAQAWNDASR